MSIPLPLRSLLLTLCLSTSYAQSTSSDPAPAPPKNLYAPAISPWAEMVWLDSLGNPQAYDEESVHILGREQAGPMQRREIQFAGDVRSLGIEFKERADWHFVGDGCTLIFREGVLNPRGALTLGMELYSKLAYIEPGNSLTVAQGGSYLGEQLYVDSGNLTLLSGTSNCRTIELVGDAQITLAGDAQLELGELTLGHRTQLQAGDLTLKPAPVGGSNQSYVIEFGDPDAYTVIKPNSIQGASLTYASLTLVGQKGSISESSISDSLIAVLGTGTQLHMQDVTLNKISLFVDTPARLEIQNLVWHLHFEHSWYNHIMQQGGTQITIFAVDGWEVKSPEAQLSGSLLLHASFHGEALDAYKDLSTHGKHLGIWVRNLAASALKLDAQNINLTLDDSITWTFDCIEQNEYGDAIIIFKKKQKK